MRVIIQRVNHSSVTVDNQTAGQISRGLVVLVGFKKEEDEAVLRPMAEKIVNMRIFPDESGRFSRSLLEIKGELLLVPQFTLYANPMEGRRPDFSRALEPEKAADFFDRFVAVARSHPIKVETGVFRAHMKVTLENDGPVTILVEL